MSRPERPWSVALGFSPSNNVIYVAEYRETFREVNLELIDIRNYDFLRYTLSEAVADIKSRLNIFNPRIIIIGEVRHVREYRDVPRFTV